MDKTEYFNQSIKKAMQIMALFSGRDKELSLAEICRRTDLHKSIVYRILVTLESEGWLARNFTTNKYMLGMKLLSFSAAILDNMVIKEIALPAMKRLADVTGETVVLAIYSNGEAICIEKIDSDNSVKITAQVGKTYPLHVGATGLSVIMGMPREMQREILFKRPLESFSDKTETDPEKVIELLAKAQKNSYIVSRGMRDPGVVAVGVPLTFPQVKIYMGMSVAGPEYRFDDKKIQFIITELQKAKNEIIGIEYEVTEGGGR